jgi:hypothetical protein
MQATQVAEKTKVKPKRAAPRGKRALMVVQHNAEMQRNFERSLAMAEPRNVYLEAARDPKVDEKKLVVLLDAANRQEDRLARIAYDRVHATLEFPIIAKHGKIVMKDKSVISYALWPEVNEAIKPILREKGIGLSFRCTSTDKQVTVTGILSYLGHREETTITLSATTVSPAMNSVQAVGSATSYGKRYTAGLLLNLTFGDAGERDDDGRAAGLGERISEDQIAALVKLAAGCKADIPKFCAALGVPSLAELPAARFDEAKTRLENYAAREAAKQPEKPKPETPQDKPGAPVPKSAKEYAVYARAWLAAETDAVKLEKRWDDERRLRNACGVTADERVAIAADMVDRKEALGQASKK